MRKDLLELSVDLSLDQVIQALEVLAEFARLTILLDVDSEAFLLLVKFIFIVWINNSWLDCVWFFSGFVISIIIFRNWWRSGSTYNSIWLSVPLFESKFPFCQHSNWFRSRYLLIEEDAIFHTSGTWFWHWNWNWVNNWWSWFWLLYN